MIVAALFLFGCGDGGDGEDFAGGGGGENDQVAGDIGGGDGDQISGDVGSIVTSTYRIVINGQGLPSAVPFSLEADLIFTVTLDLTAATNNGINPVDVAIFTTASPIIGTAGALYFGTNTSLSALRGSNLGASNIDIAFVEVTPDNTGIVITVDGNVFGLPNARLNTFNIYNITTDIITAQIHNILAGTIQIQLSPDGQSVGGTIALGGSSGFAGPGITSEYQATFSGTRIL